MAYRPFILKGALKIYNKYKSGGHHLTFTNTYKIQKLDYGVRISICQKCCMLAEIHNNVLCISDVGYKMRIHLG